MAESSKPFPRVVWVRWGIRVADMERALMVDDAFPEPDRTERCARYVLVDDGMVTVSRKFEVTP